MCCAVDRVLPVVLISLPAYYRSESILTALQDTAQVGMTSNL